MALDKLVDSAQLDSDLASVADAIRNKGGTSAQLAFPAGFVSAVEAIETGGSSVDEVTVASDGAVTQALDSGKIYHFTGTLTSLTLTLNAPSSGSLAQYHFDFESGSTTPTLTLPNTITMPDGFVVESSKRYEVDILNNFGVVMAWTLS